MADLPVDSAATPSRPVPTPVGPIGAPPAVGRPMGRPAAVEAIRLWVIAFGAIIVARVFPIDVFGWFTINAKLVAAIAFLWLPGLLVVWRRDEDYRDYGATLRQWKADLALGLGVTVAVIPLFLLSYWGYAAALRHLPSWALPLLGPYPPDYQFALRLPDQFWKHALDQFLVVGLAEEFFYRGYLQTRLRDAWPKGRVFLGARLGRAFWLTQILFAVGHLAEFHVWRLGVFFPAILFGILRERSGTIVPSALFHALSNLAVLVLEASFFAR